MRRVDIPTARLRRHEAAIQESGVGKQQVIASAVSIDAPRLLVAGDLASAGDTITVMLQFTSQRAAAFSGSEDVPAETDLAIAARSAEGLERIGTSIAAPMVRGAGADEWTAPAARAAIQGPEGRA